VSRHRNSRQAGLLKRELILARGGHACAGCGIPLDTETMTVDHKIPVSEGGGDELDNLQPMCGSCNQEKGNRMPMEERSK